MARLECSFRLVHEFPKEYIPSEADIHDLKQRLLKLLLSCDGDKKTLYINEMVALIIAIHNMECRVIK